MPNIVYFQGKLYWKGDELYAGKIILAKIYALRARGPFFINQYVGIGVCGAGALYSKDMASAKQDAEKWALELLGANESGP